MSDNTNKIQQLASQCVRCGLCASVCPTYRYARTEAESPRGRISLMATSTPDLASAHQHLSNCLGCRQCEDVCPSEVRYGELLERTQWHWREKLNKPLQKLPWWLNSLSLKTKAQDWLHRCQVISQKLPLPLQIWPFKALSSLPKAAHWHSLNNVYPSHDNGQQTVALFTGCINRAIDRQTLLDSIKLLNIAGFNVELPSTQRCCGALHLHTGMQTTYQLLKQKNQAAFADYQTIITVASGCAQTLSNYQSNIDICSFLSQQKLPMPQKKQQRIGLYSPCSYRNKKQMIKLLQNFADEIIEINAEYGCCGAAGTHMLRRPDVAQQMRTSIIEQINRQQIETIVCNNIGCSLHIKEALAKTVEIIHPISLLARAL